MALLCSSFRAQPKTSTADFRFIGAFVERSDHRKLLLFTQAASTLQSAILAILTLSNIITVNEVLVLVGLQGLIYAFEYPCRQVILIELIEIRSDLPNAIAINASLNSCARLVGPAIGGFVVASVGEGWCFTIDALTYLPLLTTLSVVHLPDKGYQNQNNPLFSGIIEGWRFVCSSLPIKTILLILAAISIFGYPCYVLLPFFADQVLCGGARTLGCLTAAGGFGSLVAGLSLSLIKSSDRLYGRIYAAILVLGFSLIFLAFAHSTWLAALLVGSIGFGLSQCAAASNSLIQVLTPDDFRSRVMSYYTMALLGTVPVGSLVAGIFASRAGAPLTVLVSGVSCLIGGFVLLIRLPELRRAANYTRTN